MPRIVRKRPFLKNLSLLLSLAVQQTVATQYKHELTEAAGHE
jgi:hypothetical protein